MPLPDQRLDVRQQLRPLHEVARRHVQEVVEHGLGSRRTVDAVLDIRAEDLVHVLVELVGQTVHVGLDVRLLVDDVVVLGVVLALQAAPKAPDKREYVDLGNDRLQLLGIPLQEVLGLVELHAAQIVLALALAAGRLLRLLLLLLLRLHGGRLVLLIF